MKVNTTIINIITNETIYRPEPVNVEFDVGDGVMIMELDVDGVIVYTNRKMRIVSGFSKDELVGSSSHIIRHPEMPKGIYKAIGEIVSDKKIWRGYVKSIRKDGKFFWSLLYAQPKFDDNEILVGAIINYKSAYLESWREAERTYNSMGEEDRDSAKKFLSGELFHSDNLATHS